VLPNYSASEENYIKNIYHLQQGTGYVTTNELAATIKAKPASITDMLKKLKAKKLVHYEPYKEFQLTVQGKKVALGIVRKHRLWEYFLVEKLSFGWDEVHEIAEELEHITSKKLIDQLDNFLDFPRFDPHGDPIPDSNGKMNAVQQILLTELPELKKSVVTMVGSQSTPLLELLKHKSINIGSSVEIKKKFDFDESLELLVDGENTATISKQLATVLFVKPV
jgi:DtxR family transcriptional regulator, Mn-dependent transcriptional regulator